MEMCAVEAMLLRADRRMDVTKLLDARRDYANALKKVDRECVSYDSHNSDIIYLHRIILIVFFL